MTIICENGDEETGTETSILQQLYECVVKFIIKKGTFLLKNELTAHFSTTHMLKPTN